VIYNGTNLFIDGTILGRLEPVAVKTTGVLSGKTITAVAAGNTNTIALASTGQVYSWGYRLNGVIGNGAGGTGNDLEPVAVKVSGALAGKTITAISLSSNHALALASTGEVFAWGDNGYGQIGDASSGNTRLEPVAIKTSGVLSGKRITSIAAGYDHSLVLDSTGRLYAFGANSNGQIGGILLVYN
jgi:alpha-tubulin suppressor-like RCC1 family protein